MTRKQRRLTMIGGSLAVLACVAALVLYAMSDSIVFFSTPSTLTPDEEARLSALIADETSAENLT